MRRQIAKSYCIGAQVQGCKCHAFATRLVAPCGVNAAGLTPCFGLLTQCLGVLHWYLPTLRLNRLAVVTPERDASCFAGLRAERERAGTPAKVPPGLALSQAIPALSHTAKPCSSLPANRAFV